MKALFVHAYRRHTAAPFIAAGGILADEALCRRMSPLQIAVAGSLRTWRVEQPQHWREAIEPGMCRLYYATCWGEVATMGSLAVQIVDRDLPVSPRDFQNSLHSSAASYATMLTDLRAPIVTSTSGFAAFDTVLLVAAKRLAAGMEHEALLIFGNGTAADDPQRLGAEDATVELLHLSRESRGLGTRSLQSIDGVAANDDVQADTFFDECQGGLPWFAPSLEHAGARVVRTMDGAAIRSVWTTVETHT